MKQGLRYKAKLEKTLADGKVTKAEANAILRDAKDGRFAQVEAHYLSAFIGLDGKKFDPVAHQKLLEFVKHEMVAFAEIAGDTGLAAPRKQPSLTAESKTAGVRYEARAGSLFIDGPGLDDAVQGQVGDCYLIAALASVAKQQPKLISDAITANPDGTYTVRFFERKENEKKPTPVMITVDATFPSRRGKPEYATARAPKELWPLIFEKAYASWKGGFDAIEGGMSATALEALTGAKPDFFGVDDSLGATEIFKRLETLTQSGAAVVALTKPWDTEQHIVDDHAYTLVGVERRGRERFVTLRNPWGEREPGNDGRDDGLFTIPLATFLANFATVEFAKLPADRRARTGTR